MNLPQQQFVPSDVPGGSVDDRLSVEPEHSVVIDGKADLLPDLGDIGDITGSFVDLQRHQAVPSALFGLS